MAKTKTRTYKGHAIRGKTGKYVVTAYDRVFTTLKKATAWLDRHVAGELAKGKRARNPRGGVVFPYYVNFTSGRATPQRYSQPVRTHEQADHTAKAYKTWSDRRRVTITETPPKGAKVLQSLGSATRRVEIKAKKTKRNPSTSAGRRYSAVKGAKVIWRGQASSFTAVSGILLRAGLLVGSSASKPVLVAGHLPGRPYADSTGTQTGVYLTYRGGYRHKALTKAQAAKAIRVASSSAKKAKRNPSMRRGYPGQVQGDARRRQFKPKCATYVQRNPRIDPESGKTTYHRDGTVTLWDIYQTQWVRRDNFPDRVLASLDRAERDRVIRHTAKSRRNPSSKSKAVSKTKVIGGKRFKSARQTPYRLKSEAKKRQKALGASRHTRLLACTGGYMVWVGGKKKVAKAKKKSRARR